LLPYDKVEEDYVSDPEAPLDAEEDEEEEEVKEMSFCKILSGPRASVNSAIPKFFSPLGGE
jgi:hypothetical protein